MYDERVAELEHLIAAANDEIIRHENMKNFAQQRYDDDTNILASVLHHIFLQQGLYREDLDKAVAESSYETSKVLSVLEYHDAVPEDMLRREYHVSITVPVTVCVTVEAANMDDAQEMASDYVDSQGLEYYDMQYDLHYNAEYEVEEA